MINLRIGGIVAAIAFLLSLLIGVFSRTTMPTLLLRPLIFAFIFFILTFGVNFIVGHFLPELLESDGLERSSDLFPGSRIDITEGDYPVSPAAYASDAPLSTAIGARPDDSEEGLGDISELAAKGAAAHSSGASGQAGMDHNAKPNYTDAGFAEDFMIPEPGESPQVSRTDSAGASAGGGAVTGAAFEDSLPDLDSMAGTFAAGSAADEQNSGGASYSGRRISSGKPPEWTEDFNAKEIAAGIRTVLKKDKEG